jgi:glucose-1-phosphate adenylyltransferase
MVQNDMLAILLAGGMGERLMPLTVQRAKPAVPFGGLYRIIDITLSNCFNSGVRRIFVLTQYKSQSLNRHVRLGWDIVSHDLGEFIEVVPPQMRVGSDWYTGTADAVYQNLYSIDTEEAEYILILSGDHIYKMDYSLMLDFHKSNNADLTVAAIQVNRTEASRFGIIETDHDQRILGFDEKPADPKPMPDKPDQSFASMGIYLFNRKALFEALNEDALDSRSAHDFGKDIIPKLIETHRVFSYDFRDENKKEAKYWRDIGTLDAYFDANMDLVSVEPIFNLYDQSWPLRTLVPQTPPAKFVFADEGARMGVAVDSIVSPGCIISGGRVANSILGTDVRVHSYSRVNNSILFPGAQVGRHARVFRAIIDNDVQIPEGEVIGFDVERDKERFTVTDSGIVVVPRGVFEPTATGRTRAAD